MQACGLSSRKTCQGWSLRSGRGSSRVWRDGGEDSAPADPDAPACSASDPWHVRCLAGPPGPCRPLGYVLSRHELGGIVYHCYAHGRDDAGGRPWLRREDSLNSAVAWMIQHEAELSALTGRLHPEPEEWPS